ncbi:V-type H+-transporting ATPase subunit H [Nematocida homosporus]|uniref:V-type H+-transporting ATPase subunit H n=1 Tax=Nematocida homosporus TaxID=1912981 RepID=UPI0022206CDA|nr:V-type H+-transporting ATPase subunit H [Nematocida homosporus]KAI5185129.1 V-type H+-transporting ATPase subunit H [Nematocida homosporus]
MSIAVYIKALSGESSQDQIRSILLDIGGQDIKDIDSEELVEKLLKLARESDLLISLKALQILTRIFRYRNTAKPEYYAIVAEMIKESPNAKKTEQVLIFMQRLGSLEYQKEALAVELFREDPIRAEMASNEDLVSAILAVCTKRECKYQGLLLLWLLTFSERALRKLEVSPLFYMLSFVSRDCKEKELRISLAIVRNYLSYSTKYNYGAFQKIEELLSVASNRGNKNDPEEQEDLNVCRARYAALSKSVSTFDSYLEELESGHLQPYSYHFSAEFWKNNLENVRSRRLEIVKALKRYLKSEDPQNIWIASNDIYRIVEAQPEAVRAIRQMDIHQALFEILASKCSEDVRFHVMEALSVCYTRE